MARYDILLMSQKGKGLIVGPSFIGVCLYNNIVDLLISVSLVKGQQTF